ncbi:MAG TPA: DUF732 domain-containing protein [Crinalium sp.]|jgi:hypothetical protein
MSHLAKAIALLIPAITLATPAIAQNVSVQELYSQVQNNVCTNNWAGALDTLRFLIGSAQITPEYRQQLLIYRHQLESHRAAGSLFDFSNDPNCANALLQSNPLGIPVNIAPPPLDWEQAVASVGALGSGSMNIRVEDEGQSAQELFWELFIRNAGSESQRVADLVGQEPIIALGQRVCPALQDGVSPEQIVTVLVQQGLELELARNVVQSGAAAFCPDHSVRLQ